MALVVVLAFVVLLCALVVGYLTRTGTDRQLADSSFNQANANILARSALDIVVSDLKQEIVDGSTASTVNGTTIYTPTATSNIVPQRSGTQTAMPNLVRRSVRSDSISFPGVGSRASAVNSTTDASVNGRLVSLPRWNAHYLIPKSNPSNDALDPVASFIAPDWILVSRGGLLIRSSIGSGLAALNNPASTNMNYVIGRYAYAVYDEGGFLDINVAGYPSPTPGPPPNLIGRKGTIAFADLTALPTTGSSFVTTTVINRIVGWRNYATASPTGIFPSFTFTTAATSSFINYFLDTSRNFGQVSTIVSGAGTSRRTDQAFLTRAQLIKLRSDTLAGSVTMLQYLGTFSRETNQSTWGGSIGQLAGRFPLNRFDPFATTPPSAAAAADIQRY